MKCYNETQVRRQDRLLDQQRAEELLMKGEYGILSIVELLDKMPAGYGVPISYAWDGEMSIYMHCALQGHKLECLNSYAQCSLCVVGATQVIPDKFATVYESIIVRGKVTHHLSDEEKMKALKLILDKYSPDYVNVGLKYAEHSFARTEVLKMCIHEISGKAKKV